MKRFIVFCFLIVSFCSFTARAAERFVSFNTVNDALLLCPSNGTITYDDNDWEGVKIAIRNLQNDLKAVTGSDKANIVIGTVGKSKYLKSYGKITKALKGKWE